MIQNGQFLLMNREEFLKWILNQKISRQITKIQNHHTWSPNYSNGNNTIEIMKNMKSYHVNTLGWSDIAQQFSTDKNGLICTGRSMEKSPAGISGGLNTGAICIENIGNFDIGGDIMTSEQSKTIVFLNAVLAIKFNLPININTIIYHTWFGHLSPNNKKTCPGTNFFGGNTQQHAINNLYPLINQEIKNIQQILNPQPQIQPWQIDCMNFLKSNGFIDYNPNNIVTFGLFGSLMNNYFSKLPNIDPIKYLLDNNFIGQSHEINKPLTWELLGWILIRRKGTSVFNPIDFLLNLGYITSAKNPKDQVTISSLGAVLKNAIIKNLGI